MRATALVIATLLWPVSAFGQTEGDVDRAVTLTLGIGNAMGWFGGQAEWYVANGRASAFVGLGYTVTSDPGHPTGVTGAGGARIYTRGQHHRLFTELSVSQIRTEWVTVDGQTFPGARRYGPGVQVGYQYISRNGLTGLASIGVGYAVGAIPRADSVGLLLGLGAGYTWRR